MLLMFLLNVRSFRWWDHVVIETLSNCNWIQNFRMSKETFYISVTSCSQGYFIRILH